MMRPARLAQVALFLIAVPASFAFGAERSSADAAGSLDKLLPHIPPVPAEQSISTFHLDPGFKIELVAAEPNVADPVDIAFDENGNLYVCELWNYPGVPKRGEPLGRIRLLTSSRHDGVYDRSTVFADNLRWPSGIFCWDGGVYVISNPDIWYLKDTRGAGKADIKTKVFTGLTGQTYEIANSLRWGLDNRIYVCGSYAGGNLRRVDGQGEAPHSRDFRFDPRTNTCEPVSGGGEWGSSFNDWGDRFTCDATHFVWHPVLPREDLARNPYLAVSSVQEQCIPEWTHVFPISKPEPWKVVRQEFWNRWVNTNSDMNAGRFPATELAPHGFATSACGLTVYRGSAFPDAYRGNAFIGEPANNVVVRLQLAEQDGPSIVAARPSGFEGRDFLASTDNRFRPVNFANGPDGCLYVVAMYREIIEDETAIPDDILKHYDLYNGRDRGRIYRILPENFQRPALPKLAGAAAAELVPFLAHGDQWVRETAQRLLYQKQDSSTGQQLRAIAQTGPTPQARICALWTMSGLGVLDQQTLERAMADQDAHVREQAVILSRDLLEKAAGLRQKLLSLCDDPSGRVRFRVALALAWTDGDDVASAAASIAKRDSAEPWTRNAVAAAVPHHSAALASILLNDSAFLRRDGAFELIGLLMQSVGARHDADEVSTVLREIAKTALDPDRRVVLLRQLAEGLARGGSSLPSQLDALRARSGKEAQAIEALFKEAAEAAANPALPENRRVEAVQLLSYAPFAAVSKTLEDLLDPSAPPPLQLAAVRSLAAHADKQVPTILLARWKTLGPSVRPDVIEALFRRSERLPMLLDAIEAKKFSAAELVPARREALLNNSDPMIRQRAAKVLGKVQSSDKQQLIDRYKREVMKLNGDPARGNVVFQSTCAICHKPEQGSAPGPNLAVLEDRTPGTLLVAILDPNREVKPSYVNFVLTTKDGQDYSGVISNETATSITIRRPGGGEDTVLRSNIASLRSTGLSLMPDGLEAAISYQQMADLLAFLRVMRD